MRSDASLSADGESKRVSYLRVTSVDISIDPDTLDRVFVIHSEEAEPVGVIISPVDLQSVLVSLAKAILRSLH